MAIMPSIPGVKRGMGSLVNKGSLPSNLLNSLQNADVITITDVIKNLSSTMFDKASPMIENALNGKIPPNETVEAYMSGMKAE